MVSAEHVTGKGNAAQGGIYGLTGGCFTPSRMIAQEMMLWEQHREGKSKGGLFAQAALRDCFLLPEGQAGVEGSS